MTALEREFVHALADGRCFITDQTVMEAPELRPILARLGNYWTRHEYLDGWATPAVAEGASAESKLASTDDPIGSSKPSQIPQQGG